MKKRPRGKQVSSLLSSTNTGVVKGGPGSSRDNVRGLRKTKEHAVCIYVIEYLTGGCEISKTVRSAGGGWGGVVIRSFVACNDYLTVDHPSLSKRGEVSLFSA